MGARRLFSTVIHCAVVSWSPLDERASGNLRACVVNLDRLGDQRYGACVMVLSLSLCTKSLPTGFVRWIPLVKSGCKIEEVDLT